VKALVLLLPLGLLLSGCGRVGPVHPPGPPERITYPRTYPAPDRPRPAPALAPAVATEAPMDDDPI